MDNQKANGNIPLSFTAGGNNYIFSDNPERFGVVSSGMYYQWGASVGTSYKDVEMYHHLNNGDGQNYPLRAGIAIQNSSGSTVTITYRCAAQAINTTGSDVETLSVCAQNLENFMKASYKTVSIPTSSKRYLCGVDSSFTKGSAKFITLHAQFKASVSSGVWFRSFVAGSQRINDLEGLFAASYMSGVSGNYTGEVGYSKMTTSLDASRSDPAMITEWPVVNNSNEYPNALNYKSPGNNKLVGNYGVIYQLNIRNAANKKIKINPKWADGRQKSSITFRVNNGVWENAVYSTGECLYRNLGSGSNATVEVMLPGGNNANWIVTFD